MSDRYVMPHENGWKIVKSAAAQASEVFDTQAAAIDRAREIVHNSGGGELIIHGEDGKIRDKRTIDPGNDSFPPSG